MADREIIGALVQGVAKWNQWRRSHPEVTRPDLSGAIFRDDDLSNADLSGAILARAIFVRADLSNADLTGANLTLANFNEAELSGVVLRGATLSGTNLTRVGLSHADLAGVDLSQAVLSGADLAGAGLFGADLTGADLTRADLSRADLTHAYLSGAWLSGTKLCGARLFFTNLSGASLSGTRFEGAIVRHTVFDDVDLSEAQGLEWVRHQGPSAIGISTIYRSEGKIPEGFLLGCGLPESLITQIPALVGAVQPIQFNSCFISYSGRDEEFARRLQSRMREVGLRVWFAPEDIKGGDKLYDQIDHAIQIHDRLLLVLSESSMRSRWVETEIRRARKVELRENRRKLFPIRLVSYERLQEWVCMDSATGEDLAEEVRGYFIPDFLAWKNHGQFEQAFERLLADLKASA